MSNVRDPIEHTGQRVTREGRAYVDAKTISRIGHVSIDEKESYIIYSRHSIVVADTTETLFYIENTSATDFVVSQIVCSTSDQAHGKVELFLVDDSAYTSGGRTLVPFNTNTGSGNSASLTAYDNDNNDLVFTAANTDEILDIRMSASTFEFDTRDSLIIAKNKVICGKCEAASIGSKIRATVYGYYRETDFTGA